MFLKPSQRATGERGGEEEGEREGENRRGRGGYSRHLISTWWYVWLNAFEQFFIKVPQPPFPPKGFPLAPWHIIYSQLRM